MWRLSPVSFIRLSKSCCGKTAGTPRLSPKRVATTLPFDSIDANQTFIGFVHKGGRFKGAFPATKHMIRKPFQLLIKRFHNQSPLCLTGRRPLFQTHDNISFPLYHLPPSSVSPFVDFPLHGGLSRDLST